MIKFFILYNIIFCISLLVNFVIIYMGYHKLGLQNNKYWKRYHDLFDIFDILYNYHLALFFYEWPFAPLETISDRIRRYLVLKTGARYKIAMFFANILNYFDKGHI